MCVTFSGIKGTGKLINTIAILADYSNFCFATEGRIDCHCNSCLSKVVEESVFEPTNFTSELTANNNGPNGFRLADTVGISMTEETSMSLESRQTPSYSYSGLSSSLVDASSYSSMQAPYSSSSIPLHFSSGFGGGSQLFGDPSANRPLDLGYFAGNTFNKQDMRLSGSGPQKVAPESRPKRKPTRRKHSRPSVACSISVPSNLPDIETFLNAQEYLDVALKPGNTLPQAKKKAFAEMLGISAAQLETCIKSNHEILPILNDLMSATAKLGLPADHVVQWFGKINTQNSTNKSSTDSAYQSQINTFDNTHTQNKKRKLNQSDDNAQKPYQCTRIDSNVQYCLREFNNSTDWKRHEETHWPQRQWECLIQGSDPTVSCHICSNNIDLLGHQLVNDHAGCVGRTFRKGHSFPRKDKLMLHVKTCHGWVANVDNWYQDVTSDWKRQCGFCGSMFLTWEARCEHVGQHFLEGKRMKRDWKDPWRSDNKTFSQGGNDDNEDDDDDDDDSDDAGSNAGGGAGGDAGGDGDSHDDLYEAEPGEDPHDSADKYRTSTGRSQKDTSNNSIGSNHGGQRRSTSSKCDTVQEVDGEVQEGEQRSDEVPNDQPDPVPSRHHGDQEPKDTFKHIKTLGHGTFSAVDEVEHRRSNFHFARKTIRVSPRRSASSLAQAQAQREVTALRRLKHPHIINILASYKWDGHLAIIMFPIAERNLSEFLLDENATTLPQISKLAGWLGCLISAVSYMHDHSCYHMDIKPQNILISGSHVILADFGGALITEKPQSKIMFNSTSIITPMYCAPEIASPGASNFLPGASDIFSLGCVFLEMVTVIHREDLQAFVDFRTFGSTNAAYSSNNQKICIWINHLSYVDKSLGLPRQNWLQIIRSMLSVDSKQRPTAQDIVHSYLIDNLQHKRHKSNEEKYLVVSNSSGSLSLIAAARLWLAECQTSHEGCYRPLTDFVPSRILDVGKYSDSIQLRQTFLGFASPYVTLSHCWGGEAEIPKTTEETLKRMQTGIQISSLPTTFAAAVHLTKALGFRYLWIDSLCIIQDSHEDWVTESSQMGKIYSHSSLTIAAITGEQLSLHIEPRTLHYEPVLSEPRAFCHSCSNGRTGFESLSEDTATTMLLDSPLLQRAWTFQERMLSPRVLYFSSTSIAWECNSSSTTLDTVGQIGKALRLQFFQKTTFSNPNIHDHLPTFPAQLLNKFMSIWKDIVREYSRRKLTFAQDKLPALSGIARELAEETGLTYVAGLWLQDLLPTGLLWSRDFATIPLPRPQYRAPSWSWASIDSPVAWSKSLTERNVQTEAEITHCGISLSSKISPFGAVSGGDIEIKGMLTRVTVARVGSEHLLQRRSLTPFAMVQWDTLQEEQDMIALDGKKHDQDSTFWCLKMVKGVGLVLRERKSGSFERAGLFWMRDEGNRESELHDDWKLRTVTIV
jgi:serine/threonine protein kinase